MLLDYSSQKFRKSSHDFPKVVTLSRSVLWKRGPWGRDGAGCDGLSLAWTVPRYARRPIANVSVGSKCKKDKCAMMIIMMRWGLMVMLMFVYLPITIWYLPLRTFKYVFLPYKRKARCFHYSIGNHEFCAQILCVKFSPIFNVKNMFPFFSTSFLHVIFPLKFDSTFFPSFAGGVWTSLSVVQCWPLHPICPKPWRSCLVSQAF